jgi:hypothetical protein
VSYEVTTKGGGDQDEREDVRSCLRLGAVVPAGECEIRNSGTKHAVNAASAKRNLHSLDTAEGIDAYMSFVDAYLFQFDKELVRLVHNVSRAYSLY